jgi:hypothetical protein
LPPMQIADVPMFIKTSAHFVLYQLVAGLFDKIYLKIMRIVMLI